MSREIVESEEFYNLMQFYRHMPIVRQKEVVKAYEAVKAHIKRLLADEREKVKEMCCRVMCYRCAEGNKPLNNGTAWLHLIEEATSKHNEDCEATPIRQLDLTKDLVASSTEEGKG